jgi:hypothetical protein
VPSLHKVEASLKRIATREREARVDPLGRKPSELVDCIGASGVALIVRGKAGVWVGVFEVISYRLLLVERQ